MVIVLFQAHSQVHEPNLIVIIFVVTLYTV